ncbi:MAG: type III secretion protein C [Psychrobacter glaciei]|jgi:type III secretion protein C
MVYKIIKTIIIIGLCLSNPTIANKMPWAGKKDFSLISNNETLAEILKNFANSYDTPVFVSDKITGNVNGKFPSIDAKLFLEQMSDVYAINWYYDGSILYFYRNDEIENQLIQLDNIKTSTLRNNLHALGIWDHQYNWKELPESGLIYLSGPPRMVEIITETAAMMDARAKDQMESTYTVQIFPLKYASAYDRALTFRQESMAVPGVVSMLKRLINGEKKTRRTLPEVSSGVEKLKGKGINKKTDKVNNTADESSIGDAGEKATIEADIRSNSVIVYDLMSRMEIYEDLIEKLDRPVDQIEISVSIINIRTNKVEDLGVSWRAGSKSNGVTGFGDMPNGAEPDGAGIGLALGSGVSFSTVLNSTSNNVFARLNMLTEEGEAQIISRPSVVSTDNMEAILDNSSTFFVRVAGTDEVDLFPISVGSVLKVTPHVIKDNNQTSIHLEINIEDGQQTQDRVDNIPTIQNSTISTRAIVKEDQSLLIGGYHFDTVVSSESRVPILSSIPIFGNLFKRTHDEHTRMARLFLITPRLIGSETNIPSNTNNDDSLKDQIEIGMSLLKDHVRPASCKELQELKQSGESNIIIPSDCFIEKELSHIGETQHD